MGASTLLPSLRVVSCAPPPMSLVVQRHYAAATLKSTDGGGGGPTSIRDTKTYEKTL